MLKKLLFFISFILSLSVNAQFKVDSLGMIQMRSAVGYDSPNSILTLGDNPNYVWGDFSNTTMGIECCIIPSSSQESVGIFSEFYPDGTSTQPYSTAIWGVSCGSSNTNFGVAGAINGRNGAGIFGTTSYSPWTSINGSYAGLFEGTVYVNGNLTTTSLYNLSDIRLKNNIKLFSDISEKNGSAVENLLKMNIITYNLNSRTKRDNNKKVYKHETETDIDDSSEQNRRHYGLSAQELQKIYPDLVLVGQDGYLAVNYTELVPILIRAIQELKMELDELKNDNAVAAYRKSSPMDITSSVHENTNLDFSKAVLFQNSPNPFSERTTIKFSLPEKTNNAYIYIFDMTGKLQKQLPINNSMQSVDLNGYELSAGMYIYSLVVNDKEIESKRMILAK